MSIPAFFGALHGWALAAWADTGASPSAPDSSRPRHLLPPGGAGRRAVRLAHGPGLAEALRPEAQHPPAQPGVDPINRRHQPLRPRAVDHVEQRPLPPVGRRERQQHDPGFFVAIALSIDRRQTANGLADQVAGVGGRRGEFERAVLWYLYRIGQDPASAGGYRHCHEHRARGRLGDRPAPGQNPTIRLRLPGPYGNSSIRFLLIEFASSIHCASNP